MENLNLVLVLMIVGMGTVFLILAFIIFFSGQLIKVTNKYAPEVIEQPQRGSNSKSNEVSSQVIAAITSAVNVASKGTMKVSKIEKI